MENAPRVQSSAVRQSGNFRQMVNDTYRSYRPKIPNQNFRNFFINGKQPVCQAQPVNSGETRKVQQRRHSMAEQVRRSIPLIHRRLQ